MLVAFAALVVVATASAAPSLGTRLNNVAQPSWGRVGFFQSLPDRKHDANEDILTTTGFMFSGEVMRKPMAMSLRGGAPMGDGGEKLSLVFVSAEVAPWSVTGGLGAVCDG